MRGLRAKRVRAVKEGTLIATVDVGATTNTGYCTSVDGRGHEGFQIRQYEGGLRDSGIWSSLPKTDSPAPRSWLVMNRPAPTPSL